MNSTRRCNFSTIKKLIHLLWLHVLWVHPSQQASDAKKAVSSPGFAFCLHFSRWQQTIKTSFFGVCGLTVIALLSANLFYVLSVAFSPSIILHFCHIATTVKWISIQNWFWIGITLPRIAKRMILDFDPKKIPRRAEGLQEWAAALEAAWRTCARYFRSHLDKPSWLDLGFIWISQAGPWLDKVLGIATPAFLSSFTIMLSFVSATRVILITTVIIIQMIDGKSNFPKTLLFKDTAF